MRSMIQGNKSLPLAERTSVARRPYSKPEAKVLGTIASLTLSTGSAGPQDSISYPHSKTTP